MKCIQYIKCLEQGCKERERNKGVAFLADMPAILSSGFRRVLFSGDN